MALFSTSARIAVRGALAATQLGAASVTVSRFASTVASRSRPVDANKVSKRFVTTTNPAKSAALAYEEDDTDRSYDTAEPTFNKQPGSKVWTYRQPFLLELGGVLPEMNVCYETWGKLNADGNNTILLHTGLSAHTHAASNEANPTPGWWEKFIGPGLALDTNKFFIVCCNVLGSCYGSTGPSSINPYTQIPYGTDFPAISVYDMVRAQFLLLDNLGVNSLHASVGSSLGGMQSLAAGALFNDRVRRVVSISAAARSHPSSIALRYAQRQAIVTDPHWQNGHFYGTGRFPETGMKTARLIGTISYRSGPEWELRFGNKKKAGQRPAHQRQFGPEFLIESYLDHQGEKFATRYDPNSLLYISKAMDMFDMGRGFPSLEDGLAHIKAPTLVLGVQSDILFPVFQQREIAHTLRKTGNQSVTYYELDAMYGHDTFLLDVKNVGSALKGHMEHEVFE
eukprot:comp20714_c0_seq1/m.27041 comp20714_c0_seq1/g.27041  ORF comp20714_c0_seq1/g.27041 comp20714_c0_seq1/m.27041 type:complete len:453 (-) comp20714_c0_seq1:38-1396(-)